MSMRGASDCLSTLLVGAAICWSGLSAAAEEPKSREQKVREDREKVTAAGFWIYNDLPKAYAEAERTGKPIVVSFRCIPCEECVKLDDELVDTDPVIRPLLEQFVCVRIIGTNGLDLDRFQFDTDQSFAMFFLGPDKTIYGRFGTRSHRTEWVTDVSLPGMAAALRGALALHRGGEEIKATLAGKQGAPLEFGSPEKYPALQDRYTDRLNDEGDVVKSCIHCHQIGDARREFYWNQNRPIPEKLLFPYPHPKSVGLVLDPDHRARIKSIVPGSPAAKLSLQPGDEILTAHDQPLLSMADVQWVLHQADPAGDRIKLRVRRGDRYANLTLQLRDGWRRRDDISWRVSSWGQSRIALGGMRLEPIEAAQRRELGIDTPMALRVRSAGRYGPHATARRQGFREGDLVVRYDGRDDLRRETDIFAWVNDHHQQGNQVEIEFLREGRRRTLRLPIQK